MKENCIQPKSMLNLAKIEYADYTALAMNPAGVVFFFRLSNFLWAHSKECDLRLRWSITRYRSVNNLTLGPRDPNNVRRSADAEYFNKPRCCMNLNNERIFILACFNACNIIRIRVLTEDTNGRTECACVGLCILLIFYMAGMESI